MSKWCNCAFQFSLFQDISYNSTAKAETTTRMDGSRSPVQFRRVVCSGTVRHNISIGSVHNFPSQHKNIRFVLENIIRLHKVKMKLRMFLKNNIKRLKTKSPHSIELTAQINASALKVYENRRRRFKTTHFQNSDRFRCLACVSVRSKQQWGYSKYNVEIVKSNRYKSYVGRLTGSRRTSKTTGSQVALKLHINRPLQAYADIL